MKTLKLLNKKNLSIIVSFLIIQTVQLFSNEPVDIWNLDKTKKTNEIIQDNNIDSDEDDVSNKSIYEMQSKKNELLEIKQEETLLSAKIDITGLYDPEENGLSIDMWANSDGEEIIKIFNKIKNIDLSKDAKELLNISLLTNSYSPNKNISNEEFLELKEEWLIKNKNLELIEEYLIKNLNIENNKKLIRFLIDDYLSKSEIEESCKVLSRMKKIFNDDYLSKFKIYCLVNSNKKDEAQLQYDLKTEIGFKDDLFEKRFNYLMGYSENIEVAISENSLLDFHLSHRTNPEFKFEPSEQTSKIIWKYLSASNLLDSIGNIDLQDQSKISLIEKATSEGNYSENDLYELYKRFQFNINQLLTVKQSYKLLSNTEGRALIYQGILITNEPESKLELLRILKDSFVNEGIGNAFKYELVEFLKKIDQEEIPSNYTKFYEDFLIEEEKNLTKIKINNKIIHQSKLLNYFREDVLIKNINKDVNDLLKKIKKDKKYYVSTKDIILLEALKADGVEVLKKYRDIYTPDDTNMPQDIQTYIENRETGLVLLRLAEVIGQDNIKDIGSETLYFIISALNQLDIDPLRNKILLKVLPLKV